MSGCTSNCLHVAKKVTMVAMHLQELLQDIKSRQQQVDLLADRAQTVSQVTAETRVATYVNQVTSRYQALLATTKVCVITLVNLVNECLVIKGWCVQSK